jgi:hypothetical protein
VSEEIARSVPPNISLQPTAISRWLKGTHQMKDLFSKCGNNCGRCPSYRENLQTDEDRQRCSEGWEEYLGFRLAPGNLRLCDGCQAPDDENPIRYQNCYVRRCAVRNGVETCAHCSAYPQCEDVGMVSLAVDAREKIAARLGVPIPEEDYLTFIEPYEGIKHLDEIRASLGPEDIVEATKVSEKARIVDFPDDLPFSKEETSAFKDLYQLLVTIKAISGDTYARQEGLKKEKRYILKLLWAFGLFGEFKEEGDSHLVIDSETYVVQKIPSSSGYSRVVKHYFGTLEEYGVHCEIVPLIESGWLTPGGALRKKGWLMKMAFDDKAGGVAALKALQRYTARLDEEYGKGAFRYFTKADMRVLSDGQGA